MEIIANLVFILTAAFIGGFVAQKIRLPLVVGYLVAGILSSTFLSSVINTQTVQSIASIGVALLMFTLGLEFSVSRIRNMGEIILVGSFVQILLSVVAGLFIFPFFGFDFYNSFFLGSVFALSSTAVVVKILIDKGEIDTLWGEITVGWLLLQDLFTLPLMVLLPSMGHAISNGSGFWWGTLSILKAFSLSTAVLLGIIFIGRKLVPMLLDAIAQTKIRELLLLGVIALCLLFATVASYMGFSFALGAFLAGMLIASTSSNHAVFSEIRPIRDVLSIIFFVSLGYLLNLQFIFSHIGILLVLTLFVMGIKFVISDLLVLALGYHTRTAFSVGMSLLSVGEFAFVLAQIGKNENLIPQETYMIILSVATLSLILSSPVLQYVDTLYRVVKHLLKKYIPKSKLFFQKYDEQIGDNKKEYSDHAVVLGHGRVGKYISKALYSTGIPYVVIDYNNHIIKNLRKEGVAVIYGDPSEIDVLTIAGVDKARVVIIAIPDRRTQEMIISHCLSLNSQVKIICRSHFEEDRIRLRNLGVQNIVQPEFEAALSITNSLLTYFQVPTLEITEKLNALKKMHGF